MNHLRMAGSKSFDCWTLGWKLTSPGQLELELYFQGQLSETSPFTVPGKTNWKSTYGSGPEADVFEPWIEARGDGEHGELSGEVKWRCAGKRGQYKGELGTW